MGRNAYLRIKVACSACEWDGIRKDASAPCPKCGSAVEAKSGHGGRTFDQGFSGKMAKKPKAKTFMTGAVHGGGNFNDQVFAGKRDVAPAGLTTGEIKMEGAPASGTSIFDPVLCELAYPAPFTVSLGPF